MLCKKHISWAELGDTTENGCKRPEASSPTQHRLTSRVATSHKDLIAGTEENSKGGSILPRDLMFSGLNLFMPTLAFG